MVWYSNTCIMFNIIHKSQPIIQHNGNWLILYNLYNNFYICSISKSNIGLKKMEEINYEPLYRLGCREVVAIQNTSTGEIIVLNKKEWNKPMFIP